MATTFDGLNSEDSWRAELRRLRDVEAIASARSKIHPRLAGIWEIWVNIRQGAGNSHIVLMLVLAAMSA
jgi:hypothetical protein